MTVPNFPLLPGIATAQRRNGMNESENLAHVVGVNSIVDQCNRQCADEELSNLP
jgi:hypothetical protein